MVYSDTSDREHELEAAVRQKEPKRNSSTPSGEGRLVENNDVEPASVAVTTHTDERSAKNADEYFGVELSPQEIEYIMGELSLTPGDDKEVDNVYNNVVTSIKKEIHDRRSQRGHHTKGRKDKQPSPQENVRATTEHHTESGTDEQPPEHLRAISEDDGEESMKLPIAQQSILSDTTADTKESQDRRGTNEEYHGIGLTPGAIINLDSNSISEDDHDIGLKPKGSIEDVASTLATMMMTTAAVAA